MSADSNLLYFPGTTGRNLRLGMPRGDKPRHPGAG